MESSPRRDAGSHDGAALRAGSHGATPGNPAIADTSRSAGTRGTRPGSTLDSELRRYAAKVAIRWSPLISCAVALALIVTLAPTRSAPTSQAQGSGAFGGAASTGRAGGVARSGSRAGTAGRVIPGTAGSATGSASGPIYTALGGAAGAGGGASSAITGSARRATGAGADTSITGIRCVPGARQFTWSAYAPPCVPAFAGNNGGATAHGVTGSTITITFRISTSGEAGVIGASEPLISKGAGTPQQSIADLQTYIRYFNTQFELYGRRVVLKPYQGQGDYLQEDQGQDLGGAQADAQTAYSLGAFGDMSLLYTTQPYAQDLAAAHVIAFGPVYFPQSWFQQYSPFAYSSIATGTKSAQGIVDVVCQRMAGMPAAFAGSPTYHHEVRKFGLITPDNPIYLENAQVVENGLRSCGAPPVRVVQYSFNFGTAASQATSAAAQMKAAGVTTVICLCDPLFPVFLTNAADQQQYHPEWVTQWWNDAYDQSFASDQWSHAISVGQGQTPPLDRQEAYRVFKAADPTSQPAEENFAFAYKSLLQLFDALQMAGPDLTPASFEKAMFSLPTSAPGGQFGTWGFGPGAFTPGQTFKVAWWNPDATSNFDQSAGAWQNCDSSKSYPYADPAALGPAHRQLSCFGSSG